MAKPTARTTTEWRQFARRALLLAATATPVTLVVLTLAAGAGWLVVLFGNGPGFSWRTWSVLYGPPAAIGALLFASLRSDCPLVIDSGLIGAAIGALFGVPLGISFGAGFRVGLWCALMGCAFSASAAALAGGYWRGAVGMTAVLGFFFVLFDFGLLFVLSAPPC